MLRLLRVSPQFSAEHPATLFVDLIVMDVGSSSATSDEGGGCPSQAMWCL